MAVAGVDSEVLVADRDVTHGEENRMESRIDGRLADFLIHAVSKGRIDLQILAQHRRELHGSPANSGFLVPAKAHVVRLISVSYSSREVIHSSSRKALPCCES